MDAQSNKKSEKCPRKKLICVVSMQVRAEGMPQVTAAKRRMISKSDRAGWEAGMLQKVCRNGLAPRIYGRRQLSKVSENGITSAYEPTAGASK